MKRRFEEKRIDRLQQLVNEVVTLTGMEEDAVEVRPYRYIPKIIFNMFMFFEIFCLLSLNLKIKGIFRLLVDWYEGNQQSVRNALENVRYEPFIIVFLPIMMLFLYFLQLHLQKQDVREVVARADGVCSHFASSSSADIPHEVKALKYHLEELRLDYDL